MKNKKFVSLLGCFLALGVAACGTRPPPDFSGRWTPVNRFADETMEIPLVGQYVFYAAPPDGTLKGLLTRWSGDTGVALLYQIDRDFTLHRPVAEIRVVSANQAAMELSRIYSSNGIEVVFERAAFIVRPRSVDEQQPAPPQSE